MAMYRFLLRKGLLSMNAHPTAPLAVMLALVLGGLFASGAQASPTPVYYYSTSGTVGGLTTGPVTFLGTGMSTVLPGSLNLGQFHTEPIPAGATLTLDNTPFSITLSESAAPGVGKPVQSAPSLTISGVINGSLSGNDSSSLEAQFTKVSQNFPGPLPFDLNALTASPIALAPSGINGGNSSFSATVSSGIAPGFFNVPEPTTLAVFATAAVGLGFRRRLRVGD